ncbi:endonuclease VII [Gordonia phage NancyRae]|uniref:Endonuclease VII n=1 Tax=Gordonia phage NancyRae TaxID=2793698 RepID=A0A7T0Q548_9CAUD|nr:endonuclease VII [Gordonia phage NancyRae]
MTENETAGAKTEAAATTSTVACKDCRAEGITKVRPTPHRGPRCHTHHQRHTAATKKRNAERRRERTYGLEAADAELVLAEQGGGCAVCGPRVTGKTRKLAVDHDHKTGVVRGLLCNQCNRILIGRYDVAALTRAIAYLLDPPAPRALGRNVVVPGHPAAALEQNAAAGEHSLRYTPIADLMGEVLADADLTIDVDQFRTTAELEARAAVVDKSRTDCEPCSTQQFPGETIDDYWAIRPAGRMRYIETTALPPNGAMLALDSSMFDDIPTRIPVKLCGHAGGAGIGAGHVCYCVHVEGHRLDSGRPHGCDCGAMWADQ